MQPGTLYSIIADTKNIPDGYPASLTQTGGVICNDIHGHFLIDVLAVIWVSLLVFFHFLLALGITSLGAVWISNSKWVDDDTNKKLAYSPNLMLTAMPILAVGAFAEVAGHLFDNWLYIGLIPTVYQAFFYGGLALGQSMLALGLWGEGRGPGLWMYILPTLSVLSFVSILYGGHSCTVKAQLAGDDNSTMYQLTESDIAYGNCEKVSWFVLSFVTLGVSTLFLFLKAKCPNKQIRNKYLCVGLSCLAFGIGVSTLITKTGHQFYHLPTVLGFTGLFYTELLFVKKIPELNKRSKITTTAGETTACRKIKKK